MNSAGILNCTNVNYIYTCNIHVATCTLYIHVHSHAKKKRSTCRWFKVFNIHLASEKKQRSLAKEITGDNMEAERAPFLFSLEKGGQEIRAVPFVYVPNLISKVADLLTHNER